MCLHCTITPCHCEERSDVAIPLGFQKCLGDCHDQFANRSRNDMRFR